MSKEFTKSPKTNLKFASRSSKNGDNNGGLDRQERSKMGFSKKFTKEKKPIRANPLKVSSLESSKKKFGENRKKFDDFNGKNSKNLENNYDYQPKKEERRQIRTTPLNVSSLKSSKKKFGDSRKNFDDFNGKNSRNLENNNFDNQPMKEERRQNRANPSKVSSFESGKKKFGDNRNNFEENSSKDSSLRTERKKFVVRNKNIEDDSGEVKPKKKKKRGIKIDRFDFSNKRLDDGNVLNDITNQQKKAEKKDDVEKVEMSMNARFRAIKPSPSILTFVEENLLGRRRDIELRRAGYNTELSAPLDNIPFTTSLERERIEESVFRNKLEFFAAAKISSSFPLPDLPEIAFAGRSNVGKSSLLNSLTRQWGVVRTSDKPGHTQTINFFNLGTKLNLVDLPGYGFAYAKEEVKEAWEDLVKEYVSTRIGLKRVCLLIDTKWGMKPRDHELIHLMERSQTKYQVVLTKSDTVFPLDVARRAMEIEETLKQHKSVVQPVMMVSSRSGAGIRCLRTALAKIARYVKP